MLVVCKLTMFNFLFSHLILQNNFKKFSELRKIRFNENLINLMRIFQKNNANEILTEKCNLVGNHHSLHYSMIYYIPFILSF